MSLDQVPSSQISFCPVSDNPSASHYLIYFFTGNPGLIGYYKTFLKTLHSLLSPLAHSTSHPTVFDIYGQSLAGFEEDVSSESVPTSPYSLDYQIQRSKKSLESLRIQSGNRKGQAYDSIILMGHSVGAYVLLEIIQRLQRTSSSLKIHAGILLFPTVTHIAQSPSGIKISTLFRIPDFPRKASIVAKSLVSLFPERILRWLVSLVTRMPPEAVEVTTRFLRSKMGIWQALHMAKDEMETITEDRWDEHIWGVERAKFEIPRLIFYFGDNDHWVANHSRDALIAARGQAKMASKRSKPTMLIDENGVDHGFCIRHSETIAEKAKIWPSPPLLTTYF